MLVQDKYKTMYEDSRKEVVERHAQVEELRNKVKNYAVDDCCSTVNVLKLRTLKNN